jgi:hypothetical protein
MRAGLIGFVLCSCQALAPSAHCDFRQAGDGDARCQERLNSVAVEVFKGTCGSGRGIASDGPCPVDDRVGGCEFEGEGDGSKLNDWYYPPRTQAEAVQICASAGGTYLDP